jgi:hypothetical protein
MKIQKFELLSENELLSRIQQTRLRGFGGAQVYQNASIQLVEAVDPNSLAPAQRYVLRDHCAVIEDLYRAFQEKGIDLFALRGALLFTPEPEGDLPAESIPFLPPIIEESIEPDGRHVWLINDGIHRVYTAKKLGCLVNIVQVRNVPPQYPYYAYALENGWEGVEELAELPDTYMKKTYRDPSHYKALFRLFNEVFPGVQEPRKKSNPSHLMA